MFGGIDSFDDSICKNCARLESLENGYKEQKKRIDELERKLEKFITNGKTEEKEELVKKQYEEQKSRLDKIEEKMENIKKTEEETTEEKNQSWSSMVKKNVDAQLKVVIEQVQKVEEKIELHAEEEKLKERKKNNIIIHRLAESKATEDKEKNSEDRKAIVFLLNEILRVPCEDKVDIKSVYRIGKSQDGGGVRPLLIEFRDATLKNRTLENLSKLRRADEKYSRISVTHDMTRSERDQCRELVKQCKEKQSKETSGEWIFKVKGLPGDMRIVKIKKDQM
jgi:tetrahydromethanopterin S-methyltransferase subunit G